MQEDKLPRFEMDVLAAAEHSFSTLESVKMYLRNRTARERLDSLALMSIQQIQVRVDEVIDLFMKKSQCMKIVA